MCYESFLVFYTLVTTSDTEFITYAASALSKGETPTDMGFLITLFEAMTEFSLVYFNVYVDCYFELLLIAVGKITASNAGAGNFLLTVFTSTYEYFYNSTGNVKTLDDSLQGSDLELIGKNLGAVIQELLTWSIPTYQVNAYEMETE